MYVIKLCYCQTTNKPFSIISKMDECIDNYKWRDKDHEMKELIRTHHAMNCTGDNPEDHDIFIFPMHKIDEQFRFKKEESNDNR